MPGQALSVIMSIFVRWKQREIRLPERRRQRTVGTETGVTQPQAQERGTLDTLPGTSRGSRSYKHRDLNP